MLRLAFACLAVLAGCAAPRSAPTAARPPESPAALARPEPDPACRGTVQGLLARNGLETVTVKLSVDHRGRAEIVHVLSPDLTPAGRIELQRAMESCVWSPRPPAGEPELFTTTWVRAPGTP